MNHSINLKPCKKCLAVDMRLSHRRWYDHILRIIGLVPLRCLACEARFYRMLRSHKKPFGAQSRSVVS